MSKRLKAVLREMKKRGLEQFILTDPHAIDYLTGVQIEPGERLFALLLRRDGQHRFFINRLFPMPVTDIPISSFDDTNDSIRMLSCHLFLSKPLGIDKSWPAGFLLALMDKNPFIGGQASYQNASICIDIVRAVKERREQRLMIKASLLNDKVMELAHQYLADGEQPSELELAAWIGQRYKDLGASGNSFTPIVAFGDHGSDPHHENSDRRYQKGDRVLLDIGCILNGYCSDMTRTVFTKEPSEKEREIYKLVLKANLAAQARVRPGVRLAEIDAAARDVIDQAGYGANFTHRLGHFIGREVHEYGDVSASSDWVAEAGMIFSIEPGIYIEGGIGVRIEDLVLVTEDGCQSLNHYPKDLSII